MTPGLIFLTSFTYIAPKKEYLLEVFTEM